MSSVEQRLRRALRLGAGVIFLMTPIELVFAEHTESAVQRLPFVAAGLGLAALLCARSSKPMLLRAATLACVAVSLIGLLGMWEHFEHNFAFQREIHPNLGTGDAALAALFGASPALAPGILLLGAGLTWASSRGARGLR